LGRPDQQFSSSRQLILRRFSAIFAGTALAVCLMPLKNGIPTLSKTADLEGAPCMS
jgi:hypothetical protein